MTTRYPHPDPLSLPVSRRATFALAASLGAGLVASCHPAQHAVAPGIRALAGSAFGPTAQSLQNFRPFVPGRAVGSKPPLPRRVGFVSPTITEYMAGLSDACGQACAERGLDFVHAVSDGDPVKNIDQLGQMLMRGVGGLVIPPLDTAAQSEIALQAIDKGVCVMFLVSAPTTTQTMSYQAMFGSAEAQAAVKWITHNIPGKGKVAYFNRDQFEALQPRTTALRGELASAGIDLVFNTMDSKATEAEGFRLASLLAQSHPEINVWIGEDDTILGVDAYLQASGKDPLKDQLCLISVGGTADAKKTVDTPGSFLRSVIASPDPLSTYACANFCADWLDGKTIPQAIEVRCTALDSRAAVAAYDAATADPRRALVQVETGQYSGLRLWGAVNYDSRSNYLRNIL